MIRLGLRLAVAGGRAHAVRVGLTIVGAAVGFSLLLLAVGLEPAIVARGERIGQRVPVPHEYDLETLSDGGSLPREDALLLTTSIHRAHGAELTVVDAARIGPAAPTPPGLPSPPMPDEVYVSPALLRQHDAVRTLSAERRIAGEISDPGLAEPDEFVLWRGWDPTELRASAPELTVVRDFPIPPPSRSWWTTEPARLLGVAGAATVILTPIGVFILVMVRLGNAQRQRRMASLALAGATRRQLRQLASVEGALIGLCATAFGWLLSLVGRQALAEVSIGGHAWFPTDLQPRPSIGVGVTILTILVAAGAGIVAVESVARSPLSTAARTAKGRVSGVRLVAPVMGLGLVASASWLADGLSPWLVAALGSAGVALLVIGVPVAGPRLVQHASRVLARRSTRAYVIIAARRLEADPQAAVRASSGIVLAVFALTLVHGYTSGNLGTASEVAFPSGASALVQPYGASAQPVDEFLQRTAQLPGVEEVVVVRQVLDPDGHSILFADCEALNATGIVVLAPCTAATWSHPDGAGEHLRGIEEVAPALVPLLANENAGTIQPPEENPGIHLGGDLIVDRALLPPDLATRAGTTLIALVGDVDTDEVHLATARHLPGHDLITRETRETAWNRALLDAQRAIALLSALVLAVGLASLVASLSGGLLAQRDTIRHLRRAGLTSRGLLATTLWQAVLPIAMGVPTAVLTGLGVAAAFTHAVQGRFLPSPTFLGAISAGSVLACLLVVAASAPVIERASRPNAPNIE